MSERDTGRSRAIHHFERNGVILPGHAATIAAYRAGGGK